MYSILPSLIALLAAGSAIASPVADVSTDAKAGTVHKIVVGSTNANKSIAFTPDNATAKKGDTLEFQFSMRNHTVTQAAFDSPCAPMAAGINSGFVPVSANQTMTTTFSVKVNSTTPMYLYCAQATHCIEGMVMTINANSTATVAALKANAAKQTKNIPAAAIAGGVISQIPAASAVPPPV